MSEGVARIKAPRRKIVKRYRSAIFQWFDFELECGHVFRVHDPTPRQMELKTSTCGDCARGYCATGKHHIVDAEGPENAAWKCTKCSYSSAE